MSLLVEEVGPVRFLTLNRPEKRNAFDASVAEGLWTELARASEDAGCRVVVVTGAGELFTAGVDVNVFLGMQGGDIEAFRKIGFLHEPIRACTKPTIAMVQGPAVGMGVTLLPHFDLVYAADHATFMVPFVKLGLLVEFGGSFTLPRLIGLSRTKELVLRGKPIDARTASDWGLVTRVFPKESLRSEVLAVANDLAAQPEGALRECRRVLDLGWESSMEAAIATENEALAKRYGSEENVAAVMAFFNRKKG
jgi:2-(1,2-epoxy-1,2-dihydrophenyl)acetyl-CoA isomerase